MLANACVSSTGNKRLTKQENKTLHTISEVVKRSCQPRVRGAATSSVATSNARMALVTFQLHLSESLANIYSLVFILQGSNSQTSSYRNVWVYVSV